jgi:secreted trypsin-like serine protease
MRITLNRAVLATCVLCAGCSASIGESQHLVVGGFTATGQHPAVGLLFDMRQATPSYACSGVLVARDVVLTAAHCLAGRQPADIGFAVANSDAAVKKDQIVVAKRLIPNPLFVGVGNAPAGIAQANDIGIVRLDGSLSSERLDLVALNHVLNRNDGLTLVGAGRSIANDPGSGGVRRYGAVSVVAVSVYEFEFSLNDEPQACNGDSGGALIIEQGGVPKLAGLVSRDDNPFDPDCSSGAIATRLSAYIDFLRQNNVVACGQDCGPDASDGGVSDGGADGGASDSFSNKSVGGGGVIVPAGDRGGCSVGRVRFDSARSGAWPLVSLFLFFAAVTRRRSRAR